MDIDKRKLDMSGRPQPDKLEHQSTSSSGWKIKRRKMVIPKNGQESPLKNGSNRRELRLPKAPKGEGQALNVKQPALLSEPGHPSPLEEQAPPSRSLFRLPVMLGSGVIAAAGILALFFAPGTTWFDKTPPHDSPETPSAAVLPDEEKTTPGAESSDLLVHAVALPSLEDDGPLPIYFRLSKPSDQPIDITYETQNYTAEAGVDFTPGTGVVTIEPGHTTVNFSVPLIDDDQVETVEMFRLILSVDKKLAELTSSELTATVLDDDDIDSNVGQ